MDMVRTGVMPSRRDASCWSVEVMNGGEGARDFSPRFTLRISKGLPSTSAITAATSSAERSSRFLSPSPW